MNPFVTALVENHKAFEVPVLYNPMIPSESRALLRMALIQEEANEFMTACDNNDLVEAADALIDLLYVTVGAMLEFGLTNIVTELFDEVQRSNMSKLENGRPIFRLDGKYLKGKNFTPPNLASIINRQIEAATINFDTNQLELDLEDK